MGRRTLLLIAALVVAALGTTGVFLYVNGVDERAGADYKLVNILVATANITPGTTAQQASDLGAIDTREYLAKSVEGLAAMSDISAIATKVALAPIAVGEPILTTQFGDLGDSSTLPIPDGKLAVSIQLGDPARVAGFITPGDVVAIMLTTSDTSGPNAGQESTRFLLPSVEVIATGAITVVPTTTGTGSSAQTEELPKAIMTLAVDQDQAQKIVYGTSHGEMYFTLLGKGAKIDPTDTGTTAKNLFN
ncbi:MAG: Flp pilus assembly protein CpaB [Sporichthyaceae bacterium]